MVTYFFKAAAAAIIAAVLALFLKRDQGGYAMLLSVTVCVLVVFCVFQLLQPIVSYFSDLAQTAKLDKVYLEPVLKCTGIGILTQIVVSVCRDAGESSLASVVELCGSAAALVLALPLFTAVLELIKELTGG